MTDEARGHEVEGGLWWNGGTWTLRSVPEGGGALPETGAPWRRVPGWVLLPLAPVVGGAFVVALPVVGAILIAQAVAQRLVAGGRRAAEDLAATVTAPAPSTGEAHLTGAPPAAPGGTAGAREDRAASSAAKPPAPEGEPLDAVEAEVRKARDQAGPG